jgi:hypothetical protein
MQSAEFENEGRELKYMTKFKIEAQRCSSLIMPKRHK